MKTSQSFLFILACGAGLLVGSSSAMADSRPAWSTEQPKDDASFRFYIGRASESANETSAFNEATRSAYESAIRENFGFDTRIDRQSYQTKTSEENLTKIGESSRDVRLTGFEQQEFYFEKSRHGFNAWILFRYSKVEITKEKDRLRAQPVQGAAISFSEQGSVRDAAKGVIEIVTTPVAGASINIDGERIFGKTPLRLYGATEPGKHSLTIDHPQFETLNRDFVSLPGQAVRIQEELVPATGRLTVVTEPAGAAVVVAGQYLGASPVLDAVVEAGKPLRVEVTHPETNNLIQEVEVAKYGGQKLDLPLQLKPAFISVSSVPSGATVSIDGKTTSSTTPTGRIPMLPGQHRISIDRHGFESHEVAIRLKGGESLVAGPFKLVHISEKKLIEKQQEEENRRRRAQEEAAQLQEDKDAKSGHGWALGVDVAYNQSTLSGVDPGWASLGLNGKYQLSRLFSCELAVAYGASASKYSNATLEISGYQAKIGFPIRIINPSQALLFKQWGQRWSVSPEMTYVINTYSVKYNTSLVPASSVQHSQMGYGGSLIYTILSAPENDDAGFFLDTRAGVHSYQSVDGLQGATPLSVSIGGGITW